MFGDHNFALWRPKIYTWSPVGPRIKKLISDPVKGGALVIWVACIELLLPVIDWPHLLKIIFLYAQLYL